MDPVAEPPEPTQKIAARLNGYRAPLIVNGATLIPLVLVLTAMYSDIQVLKAASIDRVTAERVAKMEQQVHDNVQEINRLRDEIQRLSRKSP